MPTYADFQAKEASEKIALAIMEASRRLMGWVLHSGSVYKLTNFDHAVIVSIEDSGTAYTEVSDLGSIAASKYYHDRDNKTLYLQASDSSNPNSRFLALTFRNFFSNSSVHLAHDLSTGFEVHWLPLILSVPSAAAEVDNENQLGVAIEGSGTVSFLNDQTYWSARYEKWVFENNLCLIYSFSRGLAASEAKLIFRGRIQSKTWDKKSVSFGLKDFFNELRRPINVRRISGLTVTYVDTSVPVGGYPSTYDNYFRRRIYGKVKGFRPLNVDQSIAVDGYDAGTVNGSSGSNVITRASGSDYLDYLSPNDIINFAGISTNYTIKEVDSDTQFKLTENLGSNLSGAQAYIKSFAYRNPLENRYHYIADHELSTPTASIVRMVSSNAYQVNSVATFTVGRRADLYLNLGIGGSDEWQSTLSQGDMYVTSIDEDNNIIYTDVHMSNSDLLAFKLTYQAFPLYIRQFPIDNVYLNKDIISSWRFYEDLNGLGYSVITIYGAEDRYAQTRSISGTASYSNSTRLVTGTGTKFLTEIQPWDRLDGTYDVLQVVDDTNLYLRVIPPSSSTTSIIKRVPYYQEGSDVITCDVYGLTENGTYSDTWLNDGASVAKDVLTRANLASDLDTSSFSTASNLANYDIGIVIPENQTDTTAPSIRDVLNKVNKSIFGSIIQTEDFQLAYEIVRPKVSSSDIEIQERDILSFSINSSANRAVKEYVVNYARKEYDPASKESSSQQVSLTSDIAEFLAQSDKREVLESALVNQVDAELIGRRYLFIYELAQSIIEILIKMQAARLSVNDPALFDYRKLYESLGTDIKLRSGLVDRISKTHKEISISVSDLGNAFNRIARYADSTVSSWSSASDKEKALYGYYTDQYGMIDNDSDTHGRNLYW
jgi:hypothetical protein